MRRLVLTLTADEYVQLAALAESADRDPWQEAHHIVRQRLIEQTVGLPGAEGVYLPLEQLTVEMATWIDAHPGDPRCQRARRLVECAAMAATRPDIMLQPEALKDYRQAFEHLRTAALKASAQ